MYIDTDRRDQVNDALKNAGLTGHYIGSYAKGFWVAWEPVSSDDQPLVCLGHANAIATKFGLSVKEVFLAETGDNFLTVVFSS